jgi:hypothetical protein
MKTFQTIREKRSRGMPPGDHVSDKKVNRHTVMVHKEKGKFVTYIDGDKLDSFSSQKEAEKAGIAFAKEF